MLSIESILPVAVTRRSAWDWMISQYFPAGPKCPSCEVDITGERAVAAFSEVGNVYCASCGKKFVATVGTPIHETRWTPEEYVRCLVLHLAGRSSSEIAAHLGKSQHAVRDMRERIQLIHSGSVSA